MLAHIAGLTFETEVVAAPLEAMSAERIYLVRQQSASTSQFRSVVNGELLARLPVGAEVMVVDVIPELAALVEAIDGIASTESRVGNRIAVNISSGSRLFCTAAAMVAGRREIELYYVERSSYQVERHYERGVERVVTLPTIHPHAVEVPVASEYAFVAMPFSDAFRPVYEDMLRPAIIRSGLRCARVDEVFDNQPIVDDVIANIRNARVVIADLTTKNANVIWETGVSHALGKEVILLARDIADVPSDIRHFRCIIYEDTARGAVKLIDSLTRTLTQVISRTAASALGFGPPAA